MVRLIGCCVIALGVVTACLRVDTAQQPDAVRDRADIEAALRQWPQDFNAENLAGVCGLFAEDVVLAYPDSPDRSHAEFCNRTKALFDDPSRRFRYDQPDIKEVLVDGDLATVRLFWTLTVTDTAGTVLDRTVEDGVDVFGRQPDGTWKIHISHAFPQD